VVNTGRWSEEEHQKFMEAYSKYGKNWKLVQAHIGTRTCAQARSHAQKFFVKLKKEGGSQKDCSPGHRDYQFEQISEEYDAEEDEDEPRSDEPEMASAFGFTPEFEVESTNGTSKGTSLNQSPIFLIEKNEQELAAAQLALRKRRKTTSDFLEREVVMDEPGAQPIKLRIEARHSLSPRKRSKYEAIPE